MMNYEKNPSQIEKSSMEIIEQGMQAHSHSDEELAVVKRMIHTSGDFDYQNIIDIKPGAIKAGREAIKAGCTIVTDTKMALAGINKRVLEKYNCTINNYIDHETVFAVAKEKGITRSMAAIDYASSQQVDIFVIGNAPTALFYLGELIQQQKLSPKLVIAVPVGFVGAAESKEFIRTIAVPSISTIGNKGGSNIAASVVNAILYLESR